MKKLFGIFLFILFSLNSFAQTDSVFVFDSLPPVDTASYQQIPAVQLKKFWKYHKGDNLRWADSSFDDRDWKRIDPSLDFEKLPDNTFENIGWFRLHIEVDSQFVNQTLGLMITQAGASEIYLDGKLLHRFGKIDRKNLENEERFDPQKLPVDIRFENGRKHLLAIRYAHAHAVNNFKNRGLNNPGFDIYIGKLRENVMFHYNGSMIPGTIFIFFFTFFFALCLMHLIFFLFYRTNKSNLYYSIFSALLGLYFLWIFMKLNFLIPDMVATMDYYIPHMYDFYMPALLAMLYTIFNKKIVKIFWVWLVLSIVDYSFSLLNVDIPYYGGILFLIMSLETLRIIIVSIFKKRDGAWIIGSGVIVMILFFMIFTLLGILGVGVHIGGSGWTGMIFGLITIYATLSIPISMSIYLAREFSRTSKSLIKKLIEVGDLSAKSIAQEKEKQEILSKQKENLEIQVTERTKEVVQQKKVIEEKNKDITDSINYAKRIQDAILPSEEQIKKMLPESFVLFKPKDIVSGDFYFFAHPQPLPLGGEKEQQKVLPNGEDLGGAVVVAAVDCTGHGVPGAVMSMVGHNHLKRIVSEQGITDTSQILDELHKQVLLSLNRDITKRDSKDGMDVSIVSIDKQKREVQFSGAVRPLYYFVNGSFNEVKGERYSIAGVKEIGSTPYASATITITEPTTFYLFSDGFADQFGGKDGKKLMSKNFRDLLSSIQKKSMSEQKTFLNNFIEEWKGGGEQMDDIMVIGIKL